MQKQMMETSLAGLMKILSVLLLLCLSMSFLACTKKVAGVDVEIPGQGKVTLSPAETLRVNLVSEPPSLDWHKSTDTISSQIVDNIMEGLVEYDIYDPKFPLVPALATKWESSAKATKWVFTLRENVKWTDGTPFTAAQVVDAWKRLLQPETAAEYAYFLFAVKNAQAFNQGKIKDFHEVGIKATSPTRIEIELNKSMSYFPYLLAHHSTYPIRIDVIEKYGNAWTDPSHIQTLGSFSLKAWNHDKNVVMERSESYWGPKPKIKYVVAYMIAEAGTEIDLFNSGKLDALDQVPSGEIQTLKLRREFHAKPSLLTYYYGMNTAKPPLNNALVRQAISYAIDRKQITQLLAGGQIPLTSWIPNGVTGYDDKIGIHFDPAKAKDLLKKAGYSEAKPLPKIEIAFNTNDDHKRIAENIQAQLKGNLGINVELKNEEWKTFLSHLKTDAPQIFRFGWLGDYPDADNFMNLMTSYSDNNHTNWKNKAYDELIEKAAGQEDPIKRKAIYDQAQRILVEQEVPVIPIYVGVTQYMVADRVQNYPMSPLVRKLYKGCSLK
jgi:oligopeptide transport system substrate-binding protein